jgi:hypothetical protein
MIENIDLRSAALAAIYTILAAVSGACIVGEAPAGGMSDPVSEEGTITASAETAQAMGVVTWHVAASGERVQIAGLGETGGELVQGTVTIEVTDNGDSAWELELTRPAAARTRLLLSESQPRPSSDARADLILASFVRDLLEAEPSPARGAVVPREPQLQSGDDLSMAPHMPADTAENRLKARGALRCLHAFATQSYEEPSGPGLVDRLCGLSLERSRTSYALKLYTGATATDITVVLAFAGSRALTGPTGLGGWVRDLQSQYNVPHKNPFLSTDRIGSVGVGWDVNVREQATLPINGKTMVSRLEELIRDAQKGNKSLRVFVTGHSLGAVSAELAGYDIARRLQSANIRQQVWVTIFNPPRLGLADAQSAYQQALWSPCAQPTANKLCLGLWSMTRTLDPVQSLPFGMLQVVWQATPDDGTSGGPSSAEPYCPQYDAPRASSIFLALNHSLGEWAGNITDDLSDSHLTCMFNPRP